MKVKSGLPFNTNLIRALLRDDSFNRSLIPRPTPFFGYIKDDYNCVTEKGAGLHGNEAIDLAYQLHRQHYNIALYRNLPRYCLPKWWHLPKP